MTAGSTEFLPCKVPFIGLQPSTASSNARRPLTQPRRQLLPKRNLFGAPEPGAIEKQLRAHEKEKREEFLRRYNFDIMRNGPGVPGVALDAPVERMVEPPSLPTLIAREQEAFEQNQTEAKCNSKTSQSQPAPPVKPRRNSAKSEEAADAAGAAAVVVGGAGSGSSSSERQKPYARQTLITDKFKSCKRGSLYNGKIAATAPPQSQAQQQQQQQREKQRHQIEVLNSPTQLPEATDAAPTPTTRTPPAGVAAGGAPSSSVSDTAGETDAAPSSAGGRRLSTLAQ